MYKQRYLILILTIFATPGLTQICDGNLGENIFTEGDFGSGTANILTPNPQIAPGYSYATFPPPNDGSYVITNNTTNWGGFATDAWLKIRDNSSDPNGYMMVVNASFEPGLFYEQQVEGLCENTLYVFSADFYNLIPPGENMIRPNVSFLLDGQVVYESGDIPENDQWNTYGFTFTTDPGQTTLTLALRNNAPGGLGNDIAFDNIRFQACGPTALILPEDIANICEDGSPIDIEATILDNNFDTTYLQWQESFDEGVTWQEIQGENSPVYTHTNLAGGFYYYRYVLASDPMNLMNSKCRIVSNVKIVRVVPKFYTIVDTLCQGLAFELGDNSFSETGVYTDSLKTVIGCDSIVTLELTIVPDPGLEATFDVMGPACIGQVDGSVSINEINDGAPPYTIFIDGEESLNNGSLFGFPEGEYLYNIQDRYGCQLDTIVSIPSPNVFTVDLGPDIDVELGDGVRLSPLISDSVSTLTWVPADIGDIDFSSPLQEWIPPGSIDIFLTATSTRGCVASDSLTIRVTEVRKVFIPNAFSPNGDGINDQFTINGDVPNVQAIELLQVFNRWGGLVFEQEGLAPNDLNGGWDGTDNGEELEPGLYTFVAKVLFVDNQVLTYSGDILLIR